MSEPKMTDAERVALEKKYGASNSDDEKVKQQIERKVVEHVVKFDDLPKKDEEKQHIKNMLESLSLKAFEDERQRIADSVKDNDELKEDILACDSPDQLPYFQGRVDSLQGQSQRNQVQLLLEK